MGPTTATKDTNQGKHRKHKADKIGRIGSVAMPTKSEESGRRVTKATCHAAVNNLNRHSSVMEEVILGEVNDEEAFRLCEEANVCTELPIRVLNRPQWEQQ
jgi:hypothetical protein